jgi:hypothetical protein
MTCVDDPVIALLVRVKAKVAPAAILGVVIVICPTRAFNVPEVVPATVPGVKIIPVPAVDATKLPSVAIMFPRVEVMDVPTVAEVVTESDVPAVRVVPDARVVVVVKEPGAITAEGSESVTTFPTVEAVIWLAVPTTLEIVPEVPPVVTQVAAINPLEAESPTN